MTAFSLLSLGIFIFYLHTRLGGELKRGRTQRVPDSLLNIIDLRNDLVIPKS